MKYAPHQALWLQWLQWLLLAVALLALVGGLSQPGQLQQSNAWLQDRITRSQARPATPEVVLVLADDRSIASIGRWPWRRALHAQVLRHISAGQPQSIGLDFLLTDELFAVGIHKREHYIYFLLGAGSCFYLAWVLFSIGGIVLAPSLKNLDQYHIPHSKRVRIQAG